MNLPEIRIQDAGLLRENASKHLHELWSDEGEQIADDEWMTARVASYQKVWEKYEKTILEGLCNLLNLEFRHNIIDVYIAPWFNAFSDPLVIGVTSEPDHFVDILTHELIHRLLTDNNKFTIQGSGNDLGDRWNQLFGSDQSFGCLLHIPVHAVHKAIYLDIMEEPERLERDLKITKKYNQEAYVSSWKYVEDRDYEDIVAKLKKSY
jgi:hypothetical protein